MASETLTIRLDAEVKDRLGALAESTRRTRSFLAAEAIEKYVTRELEIIEGLQRALDDEREGRTTSHDTVMAEADVIIDAARAAD